jgi:hypothetical protein
MPSLRTLMFLPELKLQEVSQQYSTTALLNLLYLKLLSFQPEQVASTLLFLLSQLETTYPISPISFKLQFETCPYG